MKRFFILILCFAMLLSLTACGGKTDSADTNRLVIWHDKEDAVITALWRKPCRIWMSNLKRKPA